MENTAHRNVQISTFSFSLLFSSLLQAGRYLSSYLSSFQQLSQRLA